MANILSLISGDGGTGKTTLALNMASLLASCNIKVLLLDCDLSTNVATYFFEDKLLTQSQLGCLSLEAVLSGQNSTDTLPLLHIKDNWDFMPSITKVKTKSQKIDLNFAKNKSKITEALLKIANSYDIVICDCQSGYSELLELLLDVSTECLAVLQTGNISSLALRSLYIKTEHIFNKQKLYQVFNKVTQEAYDIYSKVATLENNSMFIKLNPVKYDVQIEKAFNLQQIQNLETVSAGYAEAVFEICKILFDNPIVQTKLEACQKRIVMNSLLEKQKIIASQLENLNVNMEGLKNEKAGKLDVKTLLPHLLEIVIYSAMLVAIMRTPLASYMSMSAKDAAVYKYVTVGFLLLYVIWPAISVFLMLKKRKLYSKNSGDCYVDCQLAQDYLEEKSSLTHRLHELDSQIDELKNNVRNNL